ncbi:sensor domain-containing diguanylate cyclase [Pseudomaricurvus sp.]|uniref:sensor domain-containing diguanylate cyclase n=1 Tax=Pseudomaricurvus sp. TaxID=2004510 RepID=UPI003F6AA191
MVALPRNLIAFLLLCLMGITASVADNSVREIPDVVLAEGEASHRIEALRYSITKRQQRSAAVESPSLVSHWQPYTGKESRSVKNDESLWLSFVVNAENLKQDERWLLSLQLATLNHVKVYTYNKVTGERWESRAVGLKYPNKERYKQDRHPAFPLQLELGEPLQVLVEIQAPNLVAVPLQLIEEHEFEVLSDFDLLVLGLVLGTLMIMSLYNLSLFIFLKDYAYLYYTAYIACASLYLEAMTGIGPYYLWPGYQWLTDYGLLTFAALSFFMATLFLRHFLELHRYGGIILHSNTAFLAIWLVFAVCFSFSYSRFLFSALGILSIASCVVGIAVAAYLACKRSIPAMIFGVAWLALILGTLVFSLMLEGVLPFNYFTAYAQIVGMVVELILLSFALAYRIYQDRHKKEVAQGEALNLAVRVSQERSQRLEAQRKTLELQQGQTEELETQVALRTRQYEEAMEQLEEANTNLLRISMTDSLSKLSNRRCFDEMVIQECRRAYRSREPLAIVLLDIDHFKAVNDTHGHSVGDECIRRVAEALGGVVSRAGDILARYGGEEFVYLLPSTSASQAEIVAERGRTIIETMSIVTSDVELSLTISVGVAAWVPESENDYSELIEEADKALYQAKSNGRNKVVVYSAIPAEDSVLP